MKEMIQEYEKFIAQAAKHPTPGLRRYHREMVQNFQHERLVHLIVTFFFIACALGFLGVSAWLWISFPDLTGALWPIYALTLILIGMSVAYVGHYYFLENHIQKLYEYTTKIRKE